MLPGGGAGWQRRVDVATAPTTTSASPDPAPSAPLFPGLTETTLDSTGGTLRVVVADDDAERRQGLRGRSDLGPYDGMLFVFPGSDRVSFTMSTVPVALDIGFYDTALHRVGALADGAVRGLRGAMPGLPLACALRVRARDARRPPPGWRPSVHVVSVVARV